MDAEDRLRLDYDRTTALVGSLLDTRFKLLALVPTIAGTAVGLVGTPRPAVELLGIGVGLEAGPRVHGPEGCSASAPPSRRCRPRLPIAPDRARPGPIAP